MEGNSVTKWLGCYSGPTQNTVEMGSSSRCARCPQYSDEPFQCMFPIVPVQRLAVIYGRQCVRLSRPSFWASMHVPYTHTSGHLGGHTRWPGLQPHPVGQHPVRKHEVP